ncbi:MAG: ArsA family ATPase [Ilumatobacteraceae bacterium]
MATRTAPPIGALLASKEMVLVVGSGGVGKTTTAAALALSAVVESGGRVLVLTIDPARRLADALGTGGLRNEPSRVPSESLAAIGVELRGELWAAMLDTRLGWDELVRRHAPDRRTRDAVLANPLYQNLTGRFVHSHDYLAMERLHELHSSGDWDLIVVDTPPSRNALTFLDAPRRMRECFGSKLLAWLTGPYRSRLVTLASRPFFQVADRILGSRFLQDIAEFFVLFRSMERAFVDHAREVERLLADPRTSFVVVTTLEAAPSHEAKYLVRELEARRYPLGAMIANRVLPAGFTSKSSTASARKLAKACEHELADEVGRSLQVDADVVRSVLATLARGFEESSLVATREAERAAELDSISPMLLTAPMLDRDVNDLADLLELAQGWS